MQTLFQRYTNADVKICQYLRFHVKIIYGRLHIKTPFTFGDKAFKNNSVC